MQKKRLLLLSIFIVCAATNIYGQRSLNKFFRKYKRTENAEYKRAGSILMMFAHIAIAEDKDTAKEDEEEREVLKHIQSFKVLNFSSDIEQQEVHNAMKRVKSDLIKNNYDELMLVKSVSNNVDILGRIQNDNIIKDCVILIDRDNDFSVIHIKGKINLDKVKELSNGWSDEKFDITMK